MTAKLLEPNLAKPQTAELVKQLLAGTAPPLAKLSATEISHTFDIIFIWDLSGSAMTIYSVAGHYVLGYEDDHEIVHPHDRWMLITPHDQKDRGWIPLQKSAITMASFISWDTATNKVFSIPGDYAVYLDNDPAFLIDRVLLLFASENLLARVFATSNWDNLSGALSAGELSLRDIHNLKHHTPEFLSDHPEFEGLPTHVIAQLLYVPLEEYLAPCSYDAYYGVEE